MKVKDIVDIMEKHFPLELQEKWDKCGLQVGDLSQDVHRIMISLNADIYTLDAAINQGCDMLITHHPFLLDPIDNISKDGIMGKFIYKAIENRISVYSSHTALDNVKMNEWLMEALGVEHIYTGEDGISRYGQLKEEMHTLEFIEHVKNSFGLEHFRYAGTKHKISTIALCGGSGMSLIDQYLGKVDAYITGDTKYHNMKLAYDYNMLIVDVNHHVENIMVSKLKELLQQEVDVDIIEGLSPDYYIYI